MSFIAMAHFWTEAHPEIKRESDTDEFYAAVRAFHRPRTSAASII